VESEAAEEQIRLDPLSHQSGLADRDITHQRRMRQCPRRSGDGRGQSGIERQPHAIAENGLVHRRQAVRQRHGRCPIEDLTNAEVVEKRSA